MFLGIDVGTSRIKISLFHEGLEDHLIEFSDTPPINYSNFTIQPNSIWETILITLNRLFQNHKIKESIKFICVSAQAPTICVFNPSNPEICIGLSYIARRNIIEANISKLPLSPINLTCDTLEMISQIHSNMCDAKYWRCSTLTGYINYRFSRVLTIDPISKVELGLFDAGKDVPFLQQLVELKPELPENPIAKIDDKYNKGCKLLNGAILTSGTTDTVASYYGATLGKFDCIIYIGTFGSILKISNNAPNLIEFNGKLIPYTWLLSIPELGPEIFKNANNPLFNPKLDVESFFNIGLRIKPSTRKVVFSLPWWDSQNRLGSYSKPKLQDKSDYEILSRSFAESIAFFTKLVLSSHDILIDNTIVTGGICASASFRKVFTTAFNQQVKFAHIVHGSFGAALIASKPSGYILNDTSFCIENPCVLNSYDEYIRNSSFKKFIENQTKLGWKKRI
jgi:sugar (pentulose or hexulose) kinase